ncbi:MAG: hypothetical protein ABR973_13615 [Candidatus Acidiferrales bacterium]|jgi:hypothetical protein
MRRLFACVVLGVALGMVVGCAGAPVQKPTQTIAPDTATAAKLDKVSADVLALTQQNQQVINAVQKSAQDADQFRTQIGGQVSSLSQFQQRVESWLAEDVGGHWLLGVRVPAYRPGGQAGPELVDGRDRGAVHPVSGARGAVDGAPSKGAVLKKGGLALMEKLEWFVIGGIVFSLGLSVLFGFFQAVGDAIETKEHNVIVLIVNWVKAAWQRMLGKKAAAPATPTSGS